MATQAQLKANRANCQKSTGPITSAGKTRVSQNPLKTGIYAESELIKGEDPERLAQLTREMYTDFQPHTAAMREILDKLIHETWRGRRIARGETQFWDYVLTRPAKINEEFRLANALYIETERFDRIRRIWDASNRAFYRHFDTLTNLQEQFAAAEDPTPNPDPTPQPATEPAAPENIVPEAAAAEPAPEPTPEPAPTAEIPEVIHNISTAQPADEITPNPEIGFVPSNPPDELRHYGPGPRFLNDDEFRAYYQLRPGHPSRLEDCPSCSLRGRFCFKCGYETKAP